MTVGMTVELFVFVKHWAVRRANEEKTARDKPYLGKHLKTVA